MLVYQDRCTSRDARDAIHELRRRLAGLAASLTADDQLAVLIALGQVESAIADALCPEIDGPHPLLRDLRTAADALAAGSREGAEAALARVASGALPRTISISTPEGFAYYALYPAAYAAAAREWATEARPARAVVLGLRSIGTTLASVAAAALQAGGVRVTTWTLRPRGHPFDRHVAIAPVLADEWPRDAAFLLVDEGPGLSGSSLAGAAAAVEALGVPADRIVMLAAWDPEPAQLRSEAARRRWRRHRVLTGGVGRMRGALEHDGVLPRGTDISAGLWREFFAVPPPWPAAHPQHERLKIADGDRVVRFAGLGAFGETRRARAERLAAAGWMPPPGPLRQGHLELPCVAGTPLHSRDAGAPFLRHAASYIAWLRGAESRGDANTAGLAEMLRVNAAEALGEAALPGVERLVVAASAFDEPATAIDGRLQPHEWLRTADGFSKTDALDHHDDHFFPGCADAAWDVAGLIVETSAATDDVSPIVECYTAHSGDRAIAHRLPFYLAAYTAFRLGYCTLAAESLGGDEGARFALAAGGYRKRLARVLNVPPSTG